MKVVSKQLFTPSNEIYETRNVSTSVVKISFKDICLFACLENNQMQISFYNNQTQETAAIFVLKITEIFNTNANAFN
ncbi:CLUMA_CG001024, isoform A [Clunio marinus]|uniref:CLUMA_CG001024, isoform A n=1 Tax=Clunio marinus TaxID=568069 RepID=A0A1J1HIJ1_9DIPT|nr:CLUMA_CG001024, isoform A [Clunio marinus]